MLNFGTQKTMRIAQQLYEGIDVKGSGTIGVITYCVLILPVFQRKQMQRRERTSQRITAQSIQQQEKQIKRLRRRYRTRMRQSDRRTFP